MTRTKATALLIAVVIAAAGFGSYHVTRSLITQPDHSGMLTVDIESIAQGLPNDLRIDRVIITDDPSLNCGDGCFRPDEPTTIFISPELEGDQLDWVVKHEAAHVYQYAMGWPLDECHADEIAYNWGASLEYSAYQKEECNGYSSSTRRVLQEGSEGVLRQ